MQSGNGLPIWNPGPLSNDSGEDQQHDGRVDFQCGAANRVLIFIYLRRRTDKDCLCNIGKQDQRSIGQPVWPGGVDMRDEA